MFLLDITKLSLHLLATGSSSVFLNPVFYKGRSTEDVFFVFKDTVGDLPKALEWVSGEGPSASLAQDASLHPHKMLQSPVKQQPTMRLPRHARCTFIFQYFI